MSDKSPEKALDRVEEKERQEKLNKPIAERLVGTIYLQTRTETQLENDLRAVRKRNKYEAANITADWKAVRGSAVDKMKTGTFDRMKKEFIGENQEVLGERLLLFEPEPGERIVYCSKCPTVWLHVKDGKIFGQAELSNPVPMSNYGDAVTWLFQQLQIVIEKKTASPKLKEKEPKERMAHQYSKLRLLTTIVRADDEEEARKYLRFDEIEKDSEAYYKALNLLMHREALRSSLIEQLGKEHFDKVVNQWGRIRGLAQHKEGDDYRRFITTSGAFRMTVFDDGLIVGKDVRLSTDAYFLDDVQKAARFMYRRYAGRVR